MTWLCWACLRHCSAVMILGVYQTRKLKQVVDTISRTDLPIAALRHDSAPAFELDPSRVNRPSFGQASAHSSDWEEPIDQVAVYR